LLIANANISVGVLSSTFNGQLENNQDGTFTYTPAQGSRGFDQFVYQVCYTDCKDNCEIANVSIETKFAPDECVPFNIISPNGDGQNDEFVISCVDNTANFPNNSLVILNQWGDEVFRAAPYRNNWSGTYNGSSLPDGTYYYIFIPDTTGSDPQTGFITIQR
ncbi:MAG: gliding motility-associated C-terminal domain-containing protein, partial [Bacteroidota bacterium]